MLRPRSLVALVGAAALAGCLGPDPEPATGQIGLSLVGQAENGTAFRLRNAAITVVGPDVTLTFATEDNPARTAIIERLATGAYTVGLAGSWRLEQLAADGTATPVTASLLSPNPQAFTIATDAVTRVALRFGVPGGEVELGEGDLELGVDVDVLPEPDVQAVLASATVVGITEGDLEIVAVQLAAAPAADLVVTTAADDGDAVTVTPASLTFTTAAWNQPQFVQLAARHDVDVGNVTTPVRLTAAGAAPATIAVTVLDDDVLAPVVTSVPGAIDEGQSHDIGVHLDHRPLAATTVTVTSSHPAILSASPAALTFTPNDWQTAQPVALAAIADADFDDSDVTVSVAVDGRTDSFDVVARDTTEIAIGWTGVPPDVTSVPAGVITFYQVTVAEPMGIDSIALAAGGSARIQLGLYSNSFDFPATLLHATAPRSLLASIGLVEAFASPQGLDRTVGPGTYWLAVVGNGPFDVATATSGAPLVRRCRRSSSEPFLLPSSVPALPLPTCGQERSIGISAFGRP